MPENNYAPPTVEVADPPAVPVHAPPDVLQKIKNAWLAGLVSAGVTLAFSVAALFGTGVQGFDAMNLIDVVLILGLTFGIYKRSRAAAVSMLVYFLVSKIIIYVDTGAVNGVIMALIFTYLYWQGVVGTYAFHRFKAAALAERRGDA